MFSATSSSASCRGDDGVFLAKKDQYKGLSCPEGEQQETDRQNDVGNPARNTFLDAEPFLDEGRPLQVFHADRQLVKLGDIFVGTTRGALVLQGQHATKPGGIEQKRCVKHCQRRTKKGCETEQGTRQQVDHGVNAKMCADLDAVAHAEQDQPGKQNAREFQSGTPTRVETVTGHHLAEGDNGHQCQNEGNDIFFQGIDEPSNTGHESLPSRERDRSGLSA